MGKINQILESVRRARGPTIDAMGASPPSPPPPAPPSTVPSPAKIAAALGKRVFGQADAVREVSVALAKKLAGLRVGNILLVGSSGSGKTTLMRASSAFTPT